MKKPGKDVSAQKKVKARRARIIQKPFPLSLGEPARGGTSFKCWIRDSAQSPEEERLPEPFSREQYEKAPEKHLGFSWIDDRFTCENPSCRNKDTYCVWYSHEGIDYGVDVTCGEFSCPDCGMFTLVYYLRDSS